MASQDKGKPLPKFGEWDVNNPASAEGFTVIFQKARDDKKPAVGPAKGQQSVQNKSNNRAVKPDDDDDYPPNTNRWLCCM
ncbi:RPM1-interacting protein 4 (RIN4) family protein [Rhynchospora pubera]|uniref:RPM1-interacting protein 4 (RIN4) family protein n=1 Tax=Rhynchospora pubera TaxID=906938 RepID=A0AAV8FN19_9POAL|nr:RPM1-interacting protein 4 (RIN4) family protein [Rhynchospora pubera]KAJ4792191.1 RPM1-interacting protein 4 (RIN4) family protein [Rhynchospora pubera]